MVAEEKVCLRVKVCKEDEGCDLFIMRVFVVDNVMRSESLTEVCW